MRLGAEHLTCYIDALDECENSNESDIRGLVEFFEDLGILAVDAAINFRVCFSSRHFPHITVQNCEQLILEGQEGHQQDITDYIQAKLKLGKSGLAKELQATIRERASGIFLWVVLVVGILNKENDRGNVHHLRRRLKDIPDGLSKLFKDILCRGASENSYLVLTLQWILFARRQMRREEVYHALLSGVEPTL
jgi:hypothetical protein